MAEPPSWFERLIAAQAKSQETLIQALRLIIQQH